MLRDCMQAALDGVGVSEEPESLPSSDVSFEEVMSMRREGSDVVEEEILFVAQNQREKLSLSSSSPPREEVGSKPTSTPRYGKKRAAKSNPSPISPVVVKVAAADQQRRNKKSPKETPDSPPGLVQESFSTSATMSPEILSVITEDDDPPRSIAPIIVSQGLTRMATTGQILSPDRVLNLRLAHMKDVCNDGWGIVPITNKFTMPTFSANVQSATRLPDADEIAESGLILLQIEFGYKRQAIFQSVAVTDQGDSLRDLVGTKVIVTADDGVDLGLIRAVENFTKLVGGIAEAPFVRVVRCATLGDLEILTKKTRDERRMMHIANKLLNDFPTLQAKMRVPVVEFQLDYRKLIVFADLDGYVTFSTYVRALRSKCQIELNCAPRIYIQRRFATT